MEDFALFDPAIRPRQYEIYRQLRDEAPVYRAQDDFWCISRYADVKDVLLAPERFGSESNQAEALGMGMNLDPSVDPELFEQAMEVVAELPLDLGELMAGRFVVAMDPPKHTEIRRIVNRGFTPRQIEVWTEQVHDVVDRGLSTMKDNEPWELMTEMALDLPVRVIGDMLGVDEDRRADFKRWGHLVIVASQGGERRTPATTLRLLRMIKEFSDYFVPLIEDRRAHPGEDLISTLVKAEADESLTAVETIMFIIILMVAGTETTTNLVGNTTVSLLREPRELEKVLDDPSLMPRAIEETLRHETPVHFVTRQATGDQEVAGVTIPDGAFIAPLLAAGNRDPREYENPDVFDITRKETHHLSFCQGIHFCLGAHLGRLEAQIAMTTLLPHLRSRRVELSELSRMNSNLIFGFERVELLPA